MYVFSSWGLYPICWPAQSLYMWLMSKEQLTLLVYVVCHSIDCRPIDYGHDSAIMHPRNALGCDPRTWASIPPYSQVSPPPFLPPPANNFLTLYTRFCAILCMFSVNFGSYQSGIMTQRKQKYKMGLVKHIACFHFF